jgi:cytochrome c553
VRPQAFSFEANHCSWPIIDNVGGQNYQHLVQASEKFKEGQRRNSIMQSIASGLSKEQINVLAAFYADIPVADCADKKTVRQLTETA